MTSDLSNLNRVVSQEVVQHHLSLVTKHGVRVVPVTVESQHMAVVVQELLQRVEFLVRPQWLHTLVHLGEKYQHWIGFVHHV
jgi:hypothetical protein